MPVRSGFARQPLRRAPQGRAKLTRTLEQNQQYFDAQPRGAQELAIAPKVRAENITGYKPTYWQDPKAVARAYQQIQTAAGDPSKIPQWMNEQRGQIEAAYKYFEEANGGTPWTEWKYLAEDDPGRPMLESMQTPPSDWLNPNESTFADPSKAQSGQIQWNAMSMDVRKSLLADPTFDITKYPQWMHSQILSDPNFDWSKVPAWQKTYYELSSNPVTMGTAQGALMGLGGGPVGSTVGAVLGGTLGWVAAKTQYDPTKEFWQQGNVWAGLFGALNWPVEQVEKTLGLIKQVEGALKEPENFGTVGDVLGNIPAAYEAGGAYFEQMPSIFGGKDYVLGRAEPIDRPRVYQTLKDIRERIINGESGRQVVQEYQGYIGGQLSDMMLQAAADPMNFLPDTSNKIAASVAEKTGNPVWAEAFRSTEAPFEATRKYQTLVQTGEAMTIDPNFRLDTMGGLSRFIAGVNEQGQIKAGPFNEAGLLDKPEPYAGLFNPFSGEWRKQQATLTPEARAQIGAGMFYENIGAMLTMFDDPTEAAKYIKGLAKNDLTQWADMGQRFAQSPEMYTVLPAIRDFSADKVDALTSAWEMTAPNRDTLTRVADILGQEPAKLLDDLASKGTTEQDFARIVERLKQQDTPQARAMLDEVKAGRFTAQTLADVVKAFTGDTALPWHPNQWKALLLDQLGAHFDQWVVDRLGLKDTPEAKSAFFRTAKLLKSAQSILLLGGSPGYAIQNGLSNMVHRAATGIFGYLTPKQIDTWMERFDVTPARMDEGVGMGGEVAQAPSKSSVHTEAIRDAAKSASGPIAYAQNAVSKLGKAMPFNKLSGWFERTESRQGFVIAMRDFWSQSWRRGVGFSKMSPELTNALTGAGYNPDHIYAAIEAGMNQGEIERALFGQRAGMQARELVHDAAQRAGISSSEAARILEKVGVLDALDNLLTNADTPDKVQAGFRRAIQRAQDEIDMTYSRDLTARTEFVAQKTAAEGATAILDAVVDTSMPYIDTWLEHYMRMGNLWDNLDNTMGEDFNLKVIESAYQQSDQAFRRVNSWQAATWQGILKNIGMLETDFGRSILGSLADSDKALSEAYRFMLDEKRTHIEKHGKNPTAREAKGDWFASQKRVNQKFDEAFKIERRGNEAMRDAYGKYYTENYGPAAGEVARKMWQDVIDFRKQMTDTLKQFRDGGSLATSKEFYQNTYTPMIVEMGRIKQEGQAKLYQAMTGRMMPAEIAQLTQQAQVRVQTEAASVSALWDVAEQYSKMQPGNSSNYNRAAFQDKHALLFDLQNEKYGGDPTITDMNDAARKLTPEKVREILDTRKAVKEQTLATEEAARQARLQQVFEENAARAAARKTPENTTVLQAIKKHGGIDWQYIETITGEKTAKGFPPGTFSKTGKMRWALDEMARLLADDGYPINLNDPNDMGGIQQTIDLIQRARNGDKVYPVGHDYSIEAEAMAAREVAAAEEYLTETVAANDMQAWDAEVQDAAAHGDFNALADLVERIPEDVQNLPRTEGETYAEYVSRVWDETTTRVLAEQTDYAIAETTIRAQDALRAETAAGETAMTRQIFREKIASEFGLTDDMADAVMETTDGRAKGWAAAHGRTPDEWYSTHLAEAVARDTSGIQGEAGAKGAVQFMDDGRAIIRAFDGGDVSTVVHEVGHIFRRDLEGADLRIIEDWAEVKDGNWTRDAEEKFARGFEKYLAEGNAPTPKLKQVFEKFKTWLTNIYRSITGSAIDINLTDEVRAVFARLIDEEAAPRMTEQVDPARVEAEVQKVRRAREGDTLFQKAAPVDTPEFRAWFGDSKVVDENGQPLVMYHGTTKEFNIFDASKSKKTDRAVTRLLGFFFSDYKGGAERYSEWNGASGKILEVYLSIKNPYKMSYTEFENLNMYTFDKMKNNKFVFTDNDVKTWDREARKNIQNIKKDLQKKGYDGIFIRNSANDDNLEYVAFNPEQIKSVANRGTFDPNNPNILFQEATQPPGAYDQAADVMPTGPVLDEGWQRYVRPLLDSMQESAVARLNEKPLDGARDLSPEGQAMLRQYMNRVKGEMATSKLATVRWGEKQRDFAMLNYNRRYGFDRMLETVFPYQFFYTHSMLPWAMRAIDKPSWFMNYARLRNQQNRYERDIPERLRNKIKIHAPWLPDWMGDALYIDPLGGLFTPANYLRPFEQMTKDKNMQMIEAERILQEWSADGTTSQADIQQAMSHEGPTWERAMAEAGIRREAEIANPFDFFRTMFGPAWYLTTPLNYAGIAIPGISTGKRSDVTNTPLANTARAFDTVTNGSWAEPIGNVIGLMGKPEEWARQKLGLPEFGEYGDYYIDRQLANMVADGLATPQDAQVAMIERTGPLFEQAQERVKMELAMRVPLAGATYAATHEGIGAAAQAFLPSLFGSGLLPAGELEYRGMKQEWNDAWKQYDAGDTEAVNRFFEEHPEYEVYLAKGKKPAERLRSFLIGQIWDGYMALGETDKRAARLAMGDEFSQAFLNKETRSYDTLDVQKLTTWSRMLNMLTPRTEVTAPVLDNPDIQPVQPMDPRITQITDKFFNDRKRLFPNYYTLQQAYYNLPRSEQGAYLFRHPELKQYFDWKKQYYRNYPDLVPIFNGEAFKTVDVSGWPSALIDTVSMYAMTGDPLPSGARDMLKIIWLREGMPMGDFDSWLENQVAPGMLNVRQ